MILIIEITVSEWPVGLLGYDDRIDLLRIMGNLKWLVNCCRFSSIVCSTSVSFYEAPTKFTQGYCVSYGKNYFYDTHNEYKELDFFLNYIISNFSRAVIRLGCLFSLAPFVRYFYPSSKYNNQKKFVSHEFAKYTVCHGHLNIAYFLYHHWRKWTPLKGTFANLVLIRGRAKISLRPLLVFLCDTIHFSLLDNSCVLAFYLSPANGAESVAESPLPIVEKLVP